MVIEASTSFSAGATTDTRTVTGDGITTDFTVTHTAGTATPSVQVWDLDNLNAGANVRLLLSPTPENATTTTFVLRWAAAPANGAQYSILIEG